MSDNASGFAPAVDGELRDLIRSSPTIQAESSQNIWSQSSTTIEPDSSSVAGEADDYEEAFEIPPEPNSDVPTPLNFESDEEISSSPPTLPEHQPIPDSSSVAHADAESVHTMDNAEYDPIGADGDEAGPVVKIHQVRKDGVRFTVENIDMSISNSLRRAMIAEVPTIAVDIVDVFENGSVTADEFLAHRIGLLPLKSANVDQLLYSRDCECEEHCENCSVTLTLKAKCTTDEIMTVYAADIVLVSNKFGDLGQPILHGSGKGSIVVKLAKDQEIDLTLIAKKGISKEHAKWSPVSIVTSTYDPHDRLHHLDWWYEQNAGAEWPPSEYAAWEQAPQPGEPFDYDAVANLFYFKVETVGSLESDAVVQGGIKVVSNKLAQLLHLLSGEEEAEMGGQFEGPRSPDMGADGDGGAGWQAEGGYQTPFGGGGGGASAWGSASTPYGGDQN